MKKAFTLIELLVVIAIIAILAAILFPVFAQAKTAAKKAVSLSNQKQIGLALIMYANDYDDTYSREDGCTLNDSFVTSWNVQPAGTPPWNWCGAQYPLVPGEYAFRDNQYEWGKWIMPYVKSAALFNHPVIQPNAAAYNWGEIAGGYALNPAITGEVNNIGSIGNYTTETIQNYGNRVSFLGGSTTAVPAPAEAMLVMEMINQSVVPAYESGTDSSLKNLTLYPEATKEFWDGYFNVDSKTTGNSSDCYSTGKLDPTAAPFGEQVPISYCDGHTKTIPVGQFLSNTVPAVQYTGKLGKYRCGITAVHYGSGTANPSVLPKFWGGTL